MISTIHPPQSIGEPTTVQPCSASGAQQSIPCPQHNVLTRNIWVELTWLTKSNKAWKKLYYYGLEVCLLNTFTILKKVSQMPQNVLTFRIAFVCHLLEGKCFHASYWLSTNQACS